MSEIRELQFFPPGKIESPRLDILKYLLACPEPVSAYKIARDLKLTTKKVTHHVTTLLAEGAVLPNGKNQFGGPTYMINPWLAQWEDHLPMKIALVQDAIACNPEFEPEQILSLLYYDNVLTPTSVSECGEDEEEVVVQSPALDPSAAPCPPSL